MEYLLVSHTIGPSHLLHPSPAPHLQTFQVFLIYLPMCPIFNAIKSYAPNVAIHQFLSEILVQSAGEERLLFDLYNINQLC